MGTHLQKPLRRSSSNKVITGVCGGIAEWLGWDPTLVRVGFVAVSLLSAAFPGIILYVLLSFIMPEDTSY
jgi:phage shock protein PspC (stress-responsive transcriptional regulator)